MIAGVAVGLHLLKFNWMVAADFYYLNTILVQK